MTLPGPYLSDIQHIVPAVQPAWVRIVEIFGIEDDIDQPKEWADLVLPVFAYGLLPNGLGAYLTVVDADGPAWFTRHAEYTTVRIFHSVGAMPDRGVEVPGFTDGHAYCGSVFSDFEMSVWWLI
jgi:hypothetical protein